MTMPTIPVLTLSAVATGAIAAHRFVDFTDAQAALNEANKGAARHAAAIGEQVAVDAQGVVLVEAGAAVALGAEVQSDANGKAITLAAGVASGRALDAAAADGDLIRVLR